MVCSVCNAMFPKCIEKFSGVYYCIDCLAIMLKRDYDIKQAIAWRDLVLVRGKEQYIVLWTRNNCINCGQSFGLHVDTYNNAQMFIAAEDLVDIMKWKTRCGECYAKRYRSM